ncbi:MAG: dihydroorotate dehydrogenase-like protein [Ichthyobacteriaceae bacterium]|nr:dihydroorotate dehydrogenase-like protein [Ichthyobacteriaceae bacterium]
MANISTKYLGLELKSPIIIGSSELNNSVDRIKKHADAGAGAIVLKSLFEEQILMDIDAERVNNMYGTYQHVENELGYYLKKHTVDNYLTLIKETKQNVDIPVIASINCVTANEWIDFAKDVEKAGADAIEINMFILPANTDKTSKEIEKIYFDVSESITKVVSIPVSLKISPYISGLANFAQQLSYTDIKGLVLFNKFYTPSIDIEKEAIVSGSVFSNKEDNAQSLRWIGILNNKLNCDLAASTGVHSGTDVISNLLVGANAVQMVSSVFKNGDKQIEKALTELNNWMDKKGYKSIEEFRGKLSQKEVKNPMLLERVQFMKYFSESGL